MRRVIGYLVSLQRFELDSAEPDANGMMRAINEPGLGAKIDFDLIERKKTAVLSSPANEPEDDALYIISTKRRSAIVFNSISTGIATGSGRLTKNCPDMTRSTRIRRYRFGFGSVCW